MDQLKEHKLGREATSFLLPPQPYALREAEVMNMHCKVFAYKVHSQELLEGDLWVQSPTAGAHRILQAAVRVNAPL